MIGVTGYDLSTRNGVRHCLRVYANYDAAVNLLQERYRNKQLMIRSHIEQPVKLEQIISDEHTIKLRHLFTSIETHVRSLNSLDISTLSSGNFLVPIVLNKLSQKLRLDIGRQFKSPSELWKLDELLKVIKEELTARETTKVEPKSFKQGEKKREPYRNQGKPFTSQALYTRKPARNKAGFAENQSQTKTTPTCTFCAQQHPNALVSYCNGCARTEVLIKKSWKMLSLSPGQSRGS